VGGGDGTLTLAFARGGAKSVVGCDIDPRMISRAASRAAQDEVQVVHDLVGDATHLPFRDQSFDLVTTITVLAFVADAERAVREMARVLKPGGILIIGDLGKWSFWAARRRVRGWLGSRMWRAAAFRTAPQLNALVEAAQQRVDHVSGAIFFPPYLPLARRLARWDATLGERTTLGAAFIAVKSRKE
jgi:ubiquinone/menaquinone biosynthesis C-methylase UbiE